MAVHEWLGVGTFDICGHTSPWIQKAKVCCTPLGAEPHCQRPSDFDAIAPITRMAIFQMSNVMTTLLYSA